jgi:hypothetical protein
MKKFLAIVLLLIALFFLLSLLWRLPAIFIASGAALNGSGYEVGYLISTMLFVLLKVFIIFICMKYALKWLRRTPVSETLDNDLSKGIDV